MNIPHLDRRLSRLAVVQALYQMDMAQTDLDTICLQFTDPDSGPVIEEKDAQAIKNSEHMDAAFFEDLVRGIVKEQQVVDNNIRENLTKSWRLSRLDSTLRAILRAGAYELLLRTDVPPKTVITEYLEIAHGYFDKEEPKLVNAILDKLAQQGQT